MLKRYRDLELDSLTPTKELQELTNFQAKVETRNNQRFRAGGIGCDRSRPLSCFHCFSVFFLHILRMKLSSPEDALQLNSDFKSCYNTHEVVKSQGMLATLQGHSSRYEIMVKRCLGVENVLLVNFYTSAFGKFLT